MLSESRPQPQISSSRFLIPTIEQVVADAGLRLAEINCIAVTIGPGSFSGLRIGCTAAKTMAYALNVPIVAVNTLEVIAEQAAAFAFSLASNRIIATADAQRKQLFVQTFVPRGDGHWTQESEMVLVDLEKFWNRLEPGDTVAGPGLSLLDLAAVSATAKISDAACWDPTARMVGRIGADYFERQHLTDCWRLQPRYGRMSAAEEKAIQRRMNQ